MSDRQDSDKRRKHMAHMDDKREAATMTPEKAQALLDGATRGLWEAKWSKYRDGTFIVQAGMPTMRVLAEFDGDGDGPDEQEIGSAHLIAAAPDLARAYIAQAAELTRLRARCDAADKLAEAMKRAADSLGWAEAHLRDAGVKSAQVTYGERSARAALSAYEEAAK